MPSNSHPTAVANLLRGGGLQIQIRIQLLFYFLSLMGSSICIAHTHCIESTTVDVCLFKVSVSKHCLYGCIEDGVLEGILTFYHL